jgi:hypothetical protein
LKRGQLVGDREEKAKRSWPSIMGLGRMAWGQVIRNPASKGPLKPLQLKGPLHLFSWISCINCHFIPWSPPSSQVLLCSEKWPTSAQPAFVQPPHSGRPDYNPRAERHLT